jgi:hypothetical protein
MSSCADASPRESIEWKNLMLVAEPSPAVEQQLLATSADRTVVGQPGPWRVTTN